MTEPAPRHTRHLPAMPEPFRDMQNLWERMGQVFDPGWALTRTGSEAWPPLVDVEETDDAYRYELDLPGVSRDEVTVEVRDNDLCITGTFPDKQRSGTLHQQSRRTGSFSYRSTLPSSVDTNDVEASLDNGVLTVTVPKGTQSQPRKIDIT